MADGPTIVEAYCDSSLVYRRALAEAFNAESLKVRVDEDGLMRLASPSLGGFDVVFRKGQELIVRITPGPAIG